MANGAISPGGTLQIDINCYITAEYIAEPLTYYYGINNMLDRFFENSLLKNKMKSITKLLHGILLSIW